MKTQKQIKQYILDTKENIHDTHKQLKDYTDGLKYSDECKDDSYIDHLRYTIARLQGELSAFELVLMS